MRILQNERGLTLIEVLAAVVILSIVALPMMRLGTTALQTHAESQQRNQAVLLAEEVMDEAKGFVESTGDVPPERQQGQDAATGLNWSVQPEMYTDETGTEVPDLITLTVTVEMPDNPAGYRTSNGHDVVLETVARRREAN